VFAGISSRVVLHELACGLVRCASSSTLLSGLVAIAFGAWARSKGWDVPTGAELAIPAAVGWKEAKRREVDRESAEQLVRLELDLEAQAERARKAERQVEQLEGRPKRRRKVTDGF